MERERVSTQEKPLVLLCEDSKYALEKFSSIISSDDYEESNHVTEAMGETELFCIAQVSLAVHFKSFPFTYLRH